AFLYSSRIAYVFVGRLHRYYKPAVCTLSVSLLHTFYFHTSSHTLLLSLFSSQPLFLYFLSFFHSSLSLKTFMDEDILKSLESDESSMDMMTMMMQMEKFPDFHEPFYSSNNNNNLNLNLNNTENEFPYGNSNVTYHQPLSYPQQPMTMTPSLQHNGVQVPSGRINNASYSSYSDKKNSMAAMREMIFRMAVMQPINIDPETIKPPKRKNVKISKDPQSVAARHRRERISERIRILQRLVPGGTKMDTASMLDEAIHYVKFLKKQVQTLEQVGANRPMNVVGFPGMVTNGNLNYSSFLRGCSTSSPCQRVGLTSKQMLS
ncbi:hypothetical protein RYX36_003583, partial [Vicia faba]